LVTSIENEGHEVATHGYAHKRIGSQTPDEFSADLVKSIGVLETICNRQHKIFGYRAPQFSLDKKTAWTIDIMKSAKLVYDSSIFPTKTNLYGVPNAPLAPYHISSSDITIDHPSSDFWEIPLSVYNMPGTPINIPVAGGFYLRFLPYSFIRYALHSIIKHNGLAVCYIHPWELQPEHPRVRALGWYHYWRLKSTENKFRQLLNDFKFTSVVRRMNLE